MCRSILLVLVILFFSNSVYAISISPGNTVVYFEPDKTEKIDFFVTNLENDNMDVKVFIDGSQKENMNFEDQSFSLKYGEKKEFSFDFKMPTQMNSPGDFTTKIYAHQLSKANLGSGTIGATAGVISNVILRVPYEGSYLSAKITANSVSVGQPVEFKLRIDNLGSVPIPEIKGKIVIYNSLNNSVGEVIFEDSLDLNTIKEIDLYWDSKNMLADEYTAKLIITYQSKLFETEAIFKLGDLFVEIVNYKDELNSGEINEYPFTLRSAWNQKIDEVYIILHINVSGNELDFKDKSFELKPWEEVNMTSYIDARLIPPGKYDASFMVFYNGFVNSEKFVLNVKKGVNILAIVVGIMLLVIIIIGTILLKILRKQKIKLKRRK